MSVHQPTTTATAHRGPRLFGVPVPARALGLGVRRSRLATWPVGQQDLDGPADDDATEMAEAGNGPLAGSATVIHLVDDGRVDPASRAQHRKQVVAA